MMKLHRLMLIALLSGLAVSALAAPNADDARRPVTTVKVSSPLAIRSDYDGQAAVGQALELKLTISSGEAAGNAVLALAPTEGLTVIAPLGQVELGALLPGEPVTVDVTVLPLAGGTSYLRLSVTADLNGRRQRAGNSIPFRLPGGTAAQPVEEKTGKSDSSVRSLPADEEIL